MRIRPFRPAADDDESSPRFDLSSLIDISFLLLIYFLTTSTLEPKEADLGLDLGDHGPADVSIDHLHIEVAADGTVRAGGDVVDADGIGRELPGLSERLELFRTTAELLAGARIESIALAR